MPLGAPTAKQARPGLRVKVQGLQSDAGKALNGKTGTVLEAASNAGRFKVHVDEVGEKALKPVNFEVLSKEPLWGLALDDASAETIILPPGALVPRRLARRPFYVLRYASVVECGAADSSSVCLAFKTVDPTRADGLARFVAAGLGVIRGAVAADGLNFSTAGLVVPPRIRPESFCHNLAGPLRLPDGTFLMLGGESNFWTASEPKDHFGEAALQGTRALAPTTLVDPASGIFVARGPDWLYSKAWEPPTLAIRGDHAGCVDRRLRTGYRGCEYDGRLSVVHFRGRQHST